MRRIDNIIKKGNVKKDVVHLAFLILLVTIISSFIASAQVEEFCDITTTALDTPYEEHQATQLPAEVGKPVQWVKQVEVQNLYDRAISELTVTLPEDAEKIEAIDLKDNADLDMDVGQGELTITDSLEFNEEKTYLIKYETPSPEKIETGLVRKGETLVKSVIVSSENHYEDVLTYTDIPDIDVFDAADKIKLYWEVDGVKTDVTDDLSFNLQLYDTDSNGMYDQISWIAPHLSTQIFEVVIFSDADPGNYSSIGLTLLYPSDGDYMTSTSQVGFNYSVQYNSSTAVFCNLTIDGLVRRENIPTLADTQITTYFNLSSGQHSWFVHCAGDDGASNTSVTRTLTIDLDSPVVSLDTPDYLVSYSNSIWLNFTPVDDKYPVLVCSMSVNGGLNRTGIVANNNTMSSHLLTGLANGVYDWNVSCEDPAGNLGSSEERIFYISAGTPSAYNITPNKATYSIGETGYLIIDADPGSNLTMFVDTPLHDSFFRYYNGNSFPFVEMIDFANNAGTYNIDGIFSNGGQIYIVQTSFDVISSFDVNIDVNESDGVPGTAFRFEVNATGGIGGVTYEWDFDDGTTATGSEVDHTFNSVGEYNVRVTATDNVSNQVTDTQQIDIYNKHKVTITLKELQTRNILPNVSVEIDDQRKDTDDQGKAEFIVYEGKRRIYVALTGYEWVKQVRNITGDIDITIELNNTAITNYTPLPESGEGLQAAEQAQSTKSEAEVLLAQVSAALEKLESKDEATKDVLESLGVEAGLQSARKELRQAIRDLGNLDNDNELTEEEKSEKIADIEEMLASLKSSVTSVEVQDTTEFVDYPKSSDIAMLSAEYLRYKKIEYSTKEKERYIERNVELQKDVTITTRLSKVSITLLSGVSTDGAVVVNKMTKAPVNVADKVLIEYVPKEVADSAAKIKEITAFEVIKNDPILKFDPDVESYAYRIDGDGIGMDDLKKTKHVFLYEPTEEEEGLTGITGFSILPKINVENPKLVAQIAIILLLLLAYLVYHFELLDKLKDLRKDRGPAASSTVSPDIAYGKKPVVSSFITRVAEFIKKEDDRLLHELSHIKSLIMSVHNHSLNNQHDKAAEKYEQIKESYKELSPEAKSEIHHETHHVFNKVLLSKVNHLLNEAFIHLQNKRHKEAESHYSEIKNLYLKLEKEHRAAVSEQCIRLHRQLFENSLA